MNEEIERLRLRIRTLREQIRRTERLRQFFSPAVADVIVAGDPDALQPRVREVTVVFFDLRGFTAFTQQASPDEVRDVLDTFHARIGRLAHEAQGTIERFTGDGLMIFFNAPALVDRSVERAVRLALTAREQFPALAERWRAHGHELGLGTGIAHGVATVGLIGFEERRDYGVIGTVTNLAARLCQHARGSQIVAAQPVVGALGRRLDAESIGDLTLKGFLGPVAAFDIRALREREVDAVDADCQVVGVGAR